MSAQLFKKLVIPTRSGNGLTMKNRAIVAPMCQYSVTAGDGKPTDWHFVHYGALAAGGFSLVTVEATAVEARGRISPFDLGLWDDEQIEGHRRLVDFAHSLGTKIAVQLGHAGGKASTPPWLPGALGGTLGINDGGWSTVAPCATPTLPDLDTPQALSASEIDQVVASFAAAAQRANEAGYDAIQLHGAHGYLIHQFLSPLSNTRDDTYGGNWDGRTRFIHEVVAAVADIWPKDKVLGLRISATDWIDGAWDVFQSARLIRSLWEESGLTWVDISSGGLTDLSAIPIGFGYQVPLAAQLVRDLADTDVVISTVGMINNPVQAETVLRTRQAHALSFGRVALGNPHWASHAAAQLRVHPEHMPSPAPLWRAQY
ncbi:oxidoreductase [Schaalia suimastitidis]|uniref:oxidoreductase n=1 Tax=Schaalia suimastitidis TaxID=121163 RepID=UPI00042A67C8|nr:oxidoreductase [Schaalia suimastitidis]